MRLYTVAAAALLTACGHNEPKPILPAPEVIEVPVATFVPVPRELTRRCEWQRVAPPSEVFPVTEGRKRCLLRYEAQIETIERIQGKPVPADGS